MSHSTSESEDGVSPNDQMESSFVSDRKSGGGSGGVVLKKGPWTSAEDAILIDYVKKHGEGNWNAVQKHSGLFRCGKSCRLRWANHLRPNLKKGAFTPEEEQLIIELHAKMGNKWARMAAHLPGRTDNEIKNYWNTRIKRRQRAGLPLYPPEVSLQALQESQSTNAISGDGKGGHDLLPSSSYEIPDVVFDSLKDSSGILPYAPELSDITGSSILMKSLGPQYCSFMPPVMHAPKRMRESTSFLPVYNGGIKHESPFDHFQDNNIGLPDRIARSFELSFPTDPDPMTRNLESLGVVLGGHSLSNGNFSASGPALAAVKLELPSLQYPESHLGGWATSSSPPPLLDSVDGFIQSPPPTGRVESDCLSPRNSGLLDALLQEAKTLSSAKNQSFEKSSNSSAPGDVTESSTWNIGETEWENYSDAISPVGHSVTSIFNECTPISASGSSLEDPVSTDTHTGQPVKSERNEPVWMAEARKETPLQVEIPCPDALPASDWVEQCGGRKREQGTVTDGIARLLGDDLGSEYKSMGVGTSSGQGQSEGWGLGSCAWNNMPAVCQMSELP